MRRTRTGGRELAPRRLRLVAAVCDGAGEAMVGVCGELAADPGAAALLVGLGVSELSMSPLAIPLVKRAVRAVDDPEAQRLATVALAADGPTEVRDLLNHPA
ncbi:putative PEP-binding protein [Actinotalea sp.]|uniref:putative PEP-binding protein n=1 Tax=Actinotalea sp. TaxID=1872145 RepID=UPI0035679390